MRLRKPPALLLCLSLTACGIGRMESNDPIDAEAVRSLTPWRTTAKEVVEKLGAPTEVVQLGKRSAYRYDASSAKSAGESTPLSGPTRKRPSLQMAMAARDVPTPGSTTTRCTVPTGNRFQ